MRRWAAATSLTITVLLASACEQPAIPEAEHLEPPTALAASELEYVLAVDWSGATFVDGVFQFETDLGYVVGVEQWTQSSTAIELVVCEGFRGHSGNYTPDVSRLNEEVVQELTEGEPITQGPAPGDGRDYCDVYQVLGATEDEDGEARVATIKGWYRPPGSSEIVPFEAINTVPLTVLPPLGEGAWDDRLAPGFASVELLRFPSRAFDGLELDSLSPLELSFFAAEQLSQDASVTWRLGPTG
ncbi:MAG: hypothetical protein KC468_03710 [Myxococcales bacterium]|nr:hypothetical protein [Myxococcales bacterium]